MESQLQLQQRKTNYITNCREKIAKHFQDCIVNSDVAANHTSSLGLSLRIERLKQKSVAHSVISCASCGFFAPFRLTKDEKKLLFLYDRINKVDIDKMIYAKQYKQISDSLNICFGLARAAYEQQSVRCNELTACLFLQIAEERKQQKYKPKLEAINVRYRYESHGFIIENRTKGEINNISSWNPETIIHCSWYNISFSAKEWLEKSELQKEYRFVGPNPTFTSEYHIMATLNANQDLNIPIPEQALLNYYHVPADEMYSSLKTT